ncbi:C1q-like domain-containing protein [Dyadobacter sp. CY351]|uniref:C1q-like domain-containing protein n=1 Tax=Dyadobacter sp. CY351 TaxID=2909337 RepID=UPI001F2309F0|nr:hypothetical protein [Dyadobacter sp. CY351]MCF2516382.1 hypothetical protein [Dyadobacter sp. CY351]
MADWLLNNRDWLRFSNSIPDWFCLNAVFISKSRSDAGTFLFPINHPSLPSAQRFCSACLFWRILGFYKFHTSANNMRTFHLPSFSNQKLKLTFGKLALSAILLSYGPGIFAQNVGINTQQPDPSSALDIVGTDKGLLIPRVSLQSLTDNATIPNPATALLVYNTNAGLGKAGFYYNSGTPGSPAWSLVGGGEGGNLTLPFSQIATNGGPLFLINNTDANATSVAITGIGASAIGVRGATLSGKGVVGHAGSTGTGVFASATDTDGKALEVSGPIKIAGPGQSPGKGKVLMSDAVGNATWENISGNVAFRASGVKLGGSNSVPGGKIPVKIAFANENYDIGNNYNDANGSPHSTFMVPSNGIYHFDAQTMLTNVSVDYIFRLSLIVIRNGSKSVLITSRDITPISTSISTDVSLQLGDEVHIEAELDAGESGFLSDFANDSFFSGRLLFKQ